jgi:hypothetical protein
MTRRFFLIVAMFLAIASVPSLAQSLTDDEKAFLDKHMPEVVKVEPARLNDAGFLKVFSALFYQVTISIKTDDGTQTQQVIVAHAGDTLVSISRPGSEADMPNFVKMLNPDFKLKTDDDAKTMQSSLDTIYPLITDDEKKAEKFRHTGNQWVFARGKFFNDDLGFVFQTDDSGTITSAKFTLKAP